jgi:ABC-type dipeptide/oligopeptide/nickel transport system permease subunit
MTMDQSAQQIREKQIAALNAAAELRNAESPLVTTIRNLRSNKSAVIGFVTIAFLLLLMPLAPLIATHDPQQDLSRLEGYGRNIGGNPPCIPALNNLGCAPLPNNIETLHSAEMLVNYDEGTISLNSGTATIVAADINLLSNIAHVVDGVLVPPDGQSAEFEVQTLGFALPIDFSPIEESGAGEFSVLAAAIEAAELSDVLASVTPFTLLAPTDAAFAAYFEEQGITQGEFLEDPDRITDVLAYHIISGRRRDAGFFQQIGTSEYNLNLMGIDRNSRDVFSRVIYGVRTSLPVGFAAVSIAISVGTFIGLISGYLGGWADNAIMRVMDVLMAFPSLLLAIAIVTILGPGLLNALIAIAVVSIPQYARLVRASVLSIKEQEFVSASRALGAGPGRLIFLQILPNAITPIVVQGTLGVGTAILDAAALSFLGLGAQPPVPEWGLMLSEARGDFRAFPHLMFFPGIAIMITVLGFNLLGDGIRDVLDPRLGRD